MSASIEARIAVHAVAPIPPTSPAYDQAPLGHRAAMIRMRDGIPEEDMPPQRRFVLTAPPLRCDVGESFAVVVARPPRGPRRTMSRMEWQRQRAEDDAVRQMMHIHVLEARAQIDTVEDTGSCC
ncbi:hypothetical protein Tco_0154698 [Tanacetum coccineum]